MIAIQPSLLVLGVRGLAFVDLLEGDLLEFLFVGVDSDAGECRHHRRIARWRLGVANQLEIRVRLDHAGALVFDLEADIDQIAAATKAVHLRHPYTIHLGRAQPHFQLLAAVGETIAVAFGLVERAVIRQLAACQARLRSISMVRRGVEQDKHLVLVERVAVLLQFQPAQIPAQSVEMGNHEIGLDLDRSALHASRSDFLGHGRLSGRELLARCWSRTCGRRRLVRLVSGYR